MPEVKEKVKKFLEKYRMDHENVDIGQNCNIFIEEMEKGLMGKASSLKMIPTYITMDRDIPEGEPVIVMDAGGTNFRVASVYFDSNKKPVIEDFRLYSMPGTKGEITKEEFFDTVTEYMKPVLNKSNKIGFCFSYATEILPNKDGKLIRFSKEVQIKGLEGEIIGRGLLNNIEKKGYAKGMKIVLLNDTAATLLGGKASYPDRVFDSYIGFILGTGTNTCYIEETCNIKKIPGIAGTRGTMLINMESGAYGRVPRGTIDLEFDSGTVNPGEHIFEKMISGGYQGGFILSVIKKAAKEGLFSRQFAQAIACVEQLTSKEIDDFLYYPYSDNNTLASCCVKNQDKSEDDRMALYYIIDEMIERASKLVAVNLSSVMLKTGKGRNPCKPVCITAEGTTFYKSKLFKSKLDYYIKKFLNEQKGMYCEFVKADNATLIGTAIAGLMN